MTTFTSAERDRPAYGAMFSVAEADAYVGDDDLIYVS